MAERFVGEINVLAAQAKNSHLDTRMSEIALRPQQKFNREMNEIINETIS